MSEIYWINGVQLGQLCVMNKIQRKVLIDEIIDKQFIGKKYKSPRGRD